MGVPGRSQLVGRARPPRSLPLTSVVLAGGFLVVSVVAWALGWGIGVDSAVYRAGGLTLLNGDPLYDPLTTVPSWAPALPFAYPPVAAVLFTPLAVLPAQLCWGLLAALSALALGAVFRASLPAAVTTRWPAVLPVGLVAVLVLEPVWRSIALGQVNLVLMAMVLLDVLVLKGSRYCGVLTGLASAIKLTPLIFVLHLVITGRRADATRALGTFALVNVLTAVVLPTDTMRFWTVGLLDGNDAATNSWIGNQSLNGIVQRLAGHDPSTLLLVSLLSLLCLGVAAVLVVRLHRRGEHLGALLVTAFCGLLVSPVSWTHHWVWVVPLVAFLLPRAMAAGVWSRVALAAIAVVGTGWEFFVVPSGAHVELTWTPLQVPFGNAYVLTALVTATVVIVQVLRHRPGPRLEGMLPRGE